MIQSLAIYTLPPIFNHHKLHNYSIGINKLSIQSLKLLQQFHKQKQQKIPLKNKLLGLMVRKIHNHRQQLEQLIIKIKQTQIQLLKL
jgi:hypothetical protein